MNQVRPEAYRARDGRSPNAADRLSYQRFSVRTEQPLIKVCSHRPPSLHLALFFVAYVLGCGFATALAIVPGITVSIWPPGGVFIATLILAPVPSWPWWILAGCLAEMFAQLVWFHSPLAAGFLIYSGNAIAAAVGAWLVNRTCGRPVRLETLREVLAFVVLCAGVAPVVSATVGSATLAWFAVKSQTFTAVWPLFWIGDATGILLVAPLALVVLQNWRSKTRLTAAQWMEAGVLGLIFLGVAALSLSNYYLPFAYIIMPPLLWAAVRFEFKGVAVALSLLALLTMALTITGDSQFVGDPESQRERQIMLQLFLAISAFSALIVAAISRQHQQALLTLRDRERELSQLVDMVPSHLWRLTPDGEPVFFNKRMADFLGLDVADTDKPGMSRLDAVIATAIHPDDAAAFGDTLRSCLVTGDSFALRYRLRRADGTYRWMSSRAEPMRDDLGRIIQWYGLCHDIDDQMHAEEALRRSERQLQQLIDAVPAAIARRSPDGELTFFNRRMVDFLGLDVEDTDKPGLTRMAVVIQTLVHPDDGADVRKALEHAFLTGEGYSYRYRMRRADGMYRWMETRGEPLRDQRGAIVQWYSVSIDIEDEVRAQQALRDRERELSQLVDMVPVHIRRLSPEGETISFNKRLIDFVGKDVAELGKCGMNGLAGTIQTFIHPDDAAGLGETIRHSLATGKGYATKYRVRRADGIYRWMEGRGEPLRDQTGAIVQWYGISIDIDDQMRAQQAEEALRQASDKLAQATHAASLAELSASIAHEVNQPLAAIVANSHACQRWLSAEPPNVARAKITAERITRDANSAADVVSRIRALFKQSAEPRNSIALASVLAEARDLMAEEAAQRLIRLDVEVESDVPPIAFDRVQIQQVLVNLIRNGMDAMDSAASDKAIEIRVRRAGDVVRTEISDRGRGVEVPDRIFDPFYTTKEHGMGMGLAICRSIVESHRGRLWVEKNEPQGARFIFTLPVEMTTDHVNG
jgi:PAS domain S-box-containing protein